MKQRLTRAILIGLGTLAVSSANAENTGNRYGYPVLYHSEISSARAWLEASDNKWNPYREDDENNGDNPVKKPVILDVRRIEEYAAGHPVGSYNIPFPHITKSPTSANDNTSGYIGYDISEDADVNVQGVTKDGALPIQGFVDYVETLFPDKDQPLYLLCASGRRSVQAANALAKGGYTQVKNIWEGYSGLNKFAVDATGASTGVKLDLNNDGLLDNNDLDGWAYYQGLPTETKLIRSRLYQPLLSLYPANAIVKGKKDKHHDENDD